VVAAIYGPQKITVDAKGRMNFPAKFREKLGESFVITVNMNNVKHLKVYSEEDFEALAPKMQAMGKTEAEAANILRFLQVNSQDAKPDKQGRIVLSAELRKHAGIENEAIVLGAGKGAEIWNAANLAEATNDKVKENYADVTKDLNI